MPTKAKIYLAVVIAAGAWTSSAAFIHWTCRDPRLLIAWLAVALLTSFIKLRLPGVSGTYSFSFFFILSGMYLFSLPEMILIGITGALAQSLWHPQKRPTVVQIAFNMANLTLTIGACHAVAQGLFAAGFEKYRPAVLVIVAAMYFVVNTVLVSTVLSMLQGKPLLEIQRQWYLWSFPYYLVGAAIAGLLPFGKNHAGPADWLLLLAPAYLLHFYHGLQNSSKTDSALAHDDADTVTGPAKFYIAVVIAAGVWLVASAIDGWHSPDLARFTAYLLAGVLASACKIPLPGIIGTVSLGFVPVLFNLAELELSEALIISGVICIVQCYWSAKKHPRLIQVALNASALVVSTACAYFITRFASSSLNGSLPASLALGTATLYLTNTVLVSAAIALVSSRPLTSIWQRCYFYSFPYYLAGAAAASLMIATARQGGWAPALMILPLMGLVFLSYRMHLAQAPILDPVS